MAYKPPAVVTLTPFGYPRASDNTQRTNVLRGSLSLTYGGYYTVGGIGSNSFEVTTVAVSGSVSTLTYASLLGAPIAVGSTVFIAGATHASNNGPWTVQTVTTTSTTAGSFHGYQRCGVCRERQHGIGEPSAVFRLRDSNLCINWRPDQSDSGLVLVDSSFRLSLQLQPQQPHAADAGYRSFLRCGIKRACLRHHSFVIGDCNYCRYREWIDCHTHLFVDLWKPVVYRAELGNRLAHALSQQRDVHRHGLTKLDNLHRYQYLSACRIRVKRHGEWFRSD